MWLRILTRVPRSILWLLRFPPAGEEHLMRTAKQWGGDEVASRVRFSDAAQKEEHIIRCRVADIFLDTLEVCFFVHLVPAQSHNKYDSATRTQLPASKRIASSGQRCRHSTLFCALKQCAVVRYTHFDPAATSV